MSGSILAFMRVWSIGGAIVGGVVLAVSILGAAMFDQSHIVWYMVAMAALSFGLTFLAPKNWWLIALSVALPSMFLALSFAVIDGAVLIVIAAFVPALLCYLWAKERGLSIKRGNIQNKMR